MKYAPAPESKLRYAAPEASVFAVVWRGPAVVSNGEEGYGLVGPTFYDRLAALLTEVPNGDDSAYLTWIRSAAIDDG